MDNKLRILSFLAKQHPQGFTMHGLSATLGIPYATFHRAVKAMGGLVNTASVGKANVLTLNTAHPALKSYLSIASHEEREEFLKKSPILRKIASDAKGDIVLLFGSHAKQKATDTSDVDILVINAKGQRTASFTLHELLYKKKIRPIFVTTAEFLRMLREPDENVGKQAVKGHIVLRNPEAFWTLVLDGLQEGCR